MKLFVTVSAGFPVIGPGFSRGRGAKRPISRKLHENEMQWKSRGCLPKGCYIWVFLGFLEIVPEEQRTVGSVMLQFI